MKKIQILGMGCSECIKLKANAKKAAEDLGMECDIEKITGFDQILEFGVMITPALAVDGKVKIMGEVASVEEIKKMLE